MKVQLW